MMRLLALMTIREPLRWQQPAGGIEGAWFAGEDGNWPLLFASPIRTVHALWRRGAIEHATGSASADVVWRVLPSVSGMRLLDLDVVRRAMVANARRNAARQPRPLAAAARDR
jgi:hypothetical protein